MLAELRLEEKKPGVSFVKLMCAVTEVGRLPQVDTLADPFDMRRMELNDPAAAAATVAAVAGADDSTGQADGLRGVGSGPQKGGQYVCSNACMAPVGGPKKGENGAWRESQEAEESRRGGALGLGLEAVVVVVAGIGVATGSSISSSGLSWSPEPEPLPAGAARAAHSSSSSCLHDLN
jgi:hypothetical protein